MTNKNILYILYLTFYIRNFTLLNLYITNLLLNLLKIQINRRNKGGVFLTMTWTTRLYLEKKRAYISYLNATIDIFTITLWWVKRFKSSNNVVYKYKN